MRLLHTADWHLGHTLHQYSRELEHQAFLDFLLDLLVEEEIDALLIAGDIFETANPSAAAQARWYAFLSEAQKRRPALDLVVIGGNHDSAARLDAPRLLLGAMGITVVGGLPRKSDGALDLDRLIVPLRDAGGKVAAHVAAVPFLRVADLPRCPEAEDPLIAGVRAIYREVLDAARERRGEGEALLAMGHCYMTDTRISELSERRILGGNEHALPADIFRCGEDGGEDGGDPVYVALGHLHLPQSVGDEHIRYSGSPIPLSLAERTYEHQVVVVELDGPAVREIREIKIPRRVEILRVPETGDLPPEEIVPLLRDLPAVAGEDEAAHDDPEEHPYLDVHVRLPAPQPDLRGLIEEALAGRRVRLARLHVRSTGKGGDADEPLPALSELQVDEVFRLCWNDQYEEPPESEILELFHELVESVSREEA